MNLEINNYIEGQYRNYFQSFSYDRSYKEFESLYNNFPDTRLMELFSGIHADLNYLFTAMNGRLPTLDIGAHYWAEESRMLIHTIDVIHSLFFQLKGTEYEFSIDEYYDSILNDCKSWLSKSGGSEIPPHRETITIYYIKPIFLYGGENSFINEEQELSSQGELIGQGGFGAVYKYHHLIIDLDFAVKIFKPVYVSEDDKKEGEKRFFREAKMLFSLNHPNIVRIYDVGLIKGNPYIKMEYVEGKSLQDLRSQEGNFTFRDAGKAIIQILNGLQHAHNNNIIHRDLKPSNVMVQMNRGPWVCKIIDFGVSAFKETEGYTRLTRTHEQVAGGLYVDPLLSDNPGLKDFRSDIYSAGAILYYLLCGRPPMGGDVEQYLKQSNSNITDDQLKVVMKALSSNIDNRFSSCTEMIEAIEQAF